MRAARTGFSRRLFTAVAATTVIFAGSAAIATAASASGTVSHMSVNPIMSYTSTVGTNYHVYTCQRDLSVPGRKCYNPAQMQQAYGVSPLIAKGYDGHGKTIVILDAFQSPNIVNELNLFNANFGVKSMNGLGNPTDPSLGNFSVVAPQGLTPFDPNNGNMVGWAEEISLDVEWAHAMAPGANIVLDLSTDNSDTALQAAAKYAVDNKIGDVLSQSFGENETCLDSATTKAWHTIYSNAAKKNITVFASSGDEGAAQGSCDGNSWSKVVSSPASDPLVTGVGGTELDAANYPTVCTDTTTCDLSASPTPGKYTGEIAWNEGAPYGDFPDYFDPTIASGGGFSSVWDKPVYQALANHGNGNHRGVPDISYNAAVFHGVLTVLDIPGIPVGVYTFGGTSAGSPQWASLIAIADQMAKHDLGFINGDLYAVAVFPSVYHAAYHDVTSGTNSSLQYDSSNNPVDITGYSAGTGWDAVTGLGSPNASSLLPALILADLVVG
jgi:subtilase family serine protease